MRGFRLPALVVLPALLVGVAVYDAENRPEPSAAAESADVGLPAIDVVDASSSVWYCPVAAVEDTDQVSVVNLGDEARLGSVTYLPAPATYGDGVDTAIVADLEVAPGERVALAPAEQVPGDLAVAAIIEMDGGGILVERATTRAELDAADRRPCSTEAAADWFFPVGATVTEPGVSSAQEELVLLNPFPDPAVVDITFDTSNGSREPGPFEGLVVAGRSARRLDVNADVANVERASAFVRARSGRLVVDRILSYDGAVDRTGLSVSAGAVRPALDLFLPGGHLDEATTASVFLLNPDPELPAEVDIEVVGAEISAIEPFQRTVPPDGVVEVVIASDESPAAPGSEGARVLDGLQNFSVVVRSLNNVPVFAERRDLTLVRPGHAPGLSTVMASPVTATRWSALVDAVDPASSALVVQNARFDSIVTLTITPDVGDPRDYELARGSRLRIPLSDFDGAVSVDVEASGPVVVERQIVGLTSRSSALAVPWADAIRAPD